MDVSHRMTGQDEGVSMTIRCPRLHSRHVVSASVGVGNGPALFITAALALVYMAAPYARAATPTSVPDNIQALMAPEDTVLAFKPAKPFGADVAGGALVVRHAQADPATDNACELWLLRVTGDTFAVTAKDGQTVDCDTTRRLKMQAPCSCRAT
jgi:hypothetical protein